MSEEPKEEHKEHEHKPEHKKEEHKGHEHKPEHKKEHEHKHEHKDKPKFIMKKKDLKKAGVYALVALLVVSVILNFLFYNKNCLSGASTIGDTPVDTVSEKAKLEFYVMSQCPYGTQVMDAIAPVLEKLGGAVDFEANYISTDLGNGNFQSLHGEPETQGNIVQLCAAKYEPENYMKMIVCQDKSYQAIPGNWEACAEENGLDVEKIRTCFEGAEGKELLSASAAKANEAGASGSPTIFLNGELYTAGRGESDFFRVLCESFGDEAPKACSEIPEPKKIKVIALNDERCAECDIASVIPSLKSIFPGLEVEEVDYNSEKGKELYEATGVELLPALLFDESVTDGEGYSQIQRYLAPAGEYRSLKIGASFDPTKEICSNEKDDTGNGLVDCDDPECEKSLECREEKENHLQVFIMSDCPYGRKAVEALKGVVDNFEEGIDYEVHYIANEAGEGFSSLHGQYEVDENIVQLCAKEHSPEQWFDYLYCRSTKGVKGVDWKDCAGETGVDVEKVEACFEGEEGKELLREDIKIANDLGVGASPTWLANNRYQFSGIDSETVKTDFCRYNQGIEGCENTLSSDTGGVAAGSC